MKVERSLVSQNELYITTAWEKYPHGFYYNEPTETLMYWGLYNVNTLAMPCLVVEGFNPNTLEDSIEITVEKPVEKLVEVSSGLSEGTLLKAIAISQDPKLAKDLV